MIAILDTRFLFALTDESDRGVKELPRAELARQQTLDLFTRLFTTAKTKR